MGQESSIHASILCIYVNICNLKLRKPTNTLSFFVFPSGNEEQTMEQNTSTDAWQWRLESQRRENEVERGGGERGGEENGKILNYLTTIQIKKQIIKLISIY